MTDYKKHKYAEYSKELERIRKKLAEAEAKSSFDRSIELSDFFSQHDFSDESPGLGDLGDFEEILGDGDVPF